MRTDPPAEPLEVERTQVFEYPGEVIVELHGETPEGEFDAVSYVFRTDPDEANDLRPPEIAEAHEETVREALEDTEYSQAPPSA